MEYKAKDVSIKYRLCSIPEKLRLYNAVGMTPDKLGETMYSYNVFASGIEHIDHLIEKVSVKIKGKDIKSWEELLQDEEMMPHAIAVFSGILNPEKKKAAKKQ